MAIRIRPEHPEEQVAIHDLVKAAFAVLPVADGDEHEFVAAMRFHPGYIPELALVAEDNGGLLGYVLLTETKLTHIRGTSPVLLLAPLCVHPDRHSQGIGGILLKEALKRAQDLGYKAVFLAGNPAYYGRFGFRSTATFGIRHGLAVDDIYIMALELQAGFLRNKQGTVTLTGHVHCSSATGIPAKNS